MVDKIENKVLLKINQRLNDPTLDSGSNMFQNSGKSHDFEPEEKAFIKTDVNWHMDSHMYLIKYADMGISTNKLNREALLTKPGDCLVLMKTNYKPALNTNADLKVLSQDIIDGRSWKDQDRR